MVLSTSPLSLYTLIICPSTPLKPKCSTQLQKLKTYEIFLVNYFLQYLPDKPAISRLKAGLKVSGRKMEWFDPKEGGEEITLYWQPVWLFLPHCFLLARQGPSPPSAGWNQFFLAGGLMFGLQLFFNQIISPGQGG